jgi:GTP cyclohydrolase I
MNEESAQKAVEDLLLALGMELDRPDLRDTPKRMTKAFGKLLEGYSRDLSDEMTVFPNTDNYDGMIYSGKIDFFSVCEHHILPFFGTAHVAYIPKDHIAGLSKLSRAVDIFSRRFQQQERITVQVADALSNILEPKGVAVLLEGQHLCHAARGAEKVNSCMKTIAFRGDFKTDSFLRNEFLNIIK